MDDNKIPLSEMIEQLREELGLAQKQGETSKFKFEFDSVVLELSVAVSNTGSGKGGIKFWVLDAGAEYQKETANTQKFTLTLKPGSSESRMISSTSSVDIPDR